jgi:hypothetical protein
MRMGWHPVMGVRSDAMVRLARLAGGIDVHGCARQELQVMTELVLDFLGEIVPFFDGHSRCDGNTGLCIQSMPDPTSAHISQSMHSGYVRGGMPHFVKHLWLDSIQHSGENCFHRLLIPIANCFLIATRS